MSLLSEGQIIRETYEVERKLGEGAFAEVYRVKHRFLGRQAMKVFKTVGMTVEETEQALSEAIMLSRIGHPNIVRVFDANVIQTSNGTCGFFTMEYVAGGTLEQFWRSHGSNLVPVETSVELIRQVCRGLAVGHSERPPVIHRDIKPQNILVGYDAAGLRVRVSDFGLAKRVNPLTLLASARGTRTFKPPEVFRSAQSDSRAGDVWAVGSVLYLLLTDRLPYVANEDMGLVDDKCFDEAPIVPSRLNIQVDPTLETICLRALATAVQDRYPSAIELLEELTKWKPRPKTAAGVTKVPSSDASKSVLGLYSPGDEDHARKIVQQAIRLSQQAGKLGDAADLMEEAFNKLPSLRIDKEHILQLWRRGIVAPFGSPTSRS
jgi:serine/threonine-protein kinase